MALRRPKKRDALNMSTKLSISTRFPRFVLMLIMFIIYYNNALILKLSLITHSISVWSIVYQKDFLPSGVFYQILRGAQSFPYYFILNCSKQVIQFNLLFRQEVVEMPSIPKFITRNNASNRVILEQI